MQFIIGSKQTTKMVELGKAIRVYVAQDTDPRMKDNIVRLCTSAGVPITWVDTMQGLGETCGIEVGAAMAAVVQETK
ncbi:ribosomal L7Ae/L30e/S12e/Gadd45 family protein [Paenibacillus sp. sptzw28]|uniref:ribosomal L7Ae/L30e/S12e/Gadd45 family protein n=1 Tax=Paenibacillus sp. sptzw28 TaxID=715179 RepID=UPI001C6E7111|nr:ribosomal L7Ae/L30e/S12e/Gadd45 family protein [Paenibacillus sp. sptzw28]QYR22171.1 ribosomal L7Ae/L30e/S12e/Gadd45 family protein [Paenibacillus sp. sptzw28]